MLDAGLRVHAFFTSRDGGVSADPYRSLNLADHVGDDPAAVAANRETVELIAGAPVSFLIAEHGTTVAHVDHPGELPGPADVLVTSMPGVAIATIAADCVPVLLHDHGSGAVAAVHAGREGLYAGVIDSAVEALIGARTGAQHQGQLSAAIGPAICGRCYEVPESLRAQVGTRHPAAVATTSWGSPALDLPRAVETRLGELGLEQIVRHRWCTLESAEYYSHRRDGVTGRFAGVIVCAESSGVSLH